MRKFFQVICLRVEWNSSWYTVNEILNCIYWLQLLSLFAGVLTGLSQCEWFIVIILICGMFALELMNSAIERVVDL